MGVERFLPVQGNELVSFVGGPKDKMGLKLDFPLPKRIVLDGHLYEIEYEVFPIFIDDSEEHSVTRVTLEQIENGTTPDLGDNDQFDVFYMYRGYARLN